MEGVLLSSQIQGLFCLEIVIGVNINCMYFFLCNVKIYLAIIYGLDIFGNNTYRGEFLKPP